MKNSTSHRDTHKYSIWRMIHINYTQSDSVTPDSVMISLFIISGQSVSLNFPTKLGVALQVLTLLIFGFSGRFLSLHDDQTNRRSTCVHSCSFIHSVDLNQWMKDSLNQSGFSKDCLPRLMFWLVSVPTERLVDFYVNVQPSASPCLHLLLTTELWWRCQGRSDLRNSNCAWTPATWTPYPPPAAATRQSSAPLWWRSGRRPIL